MEFTLVGKQEFDDGSVIAPRNPSSQAYLSCRPHMWFWFDHVHRSFVLNFYILTPPGVVLPDAFEAELIARVEEPHYYRIDYGVYTQRQSVFKYNLSLYACNNVPTKAGLLPKDSDIETRVAIQLSVLDSTGEDPLGKSTIIVDEVDDIPFMGSED